MDFIFKIQFQILDSFFECHRFFRDFVYESIAENRYSVFGQTNVCRMSDAQFKERFIE
jgi:predicted DCC family thiol-disulfide oxidoreductase YuxK